MDNGGILITSISEFQEVIDEMKSSWANLNEIFTNQIRNVDRIDETDVWSGAAARALHDKYKMLNGNYSQIGYSLDLYIKFLEKTLEDYVRLIQEQEKNVDAMASNLDVNS